MFSKKETEEGGEKKEEDKDDKKEEDSSDDDDDEEEEEEADYNEDEYDENGQPYSERAIRWSIQNFGDKSGTRFFKHVGDRAVRDIEEMKRKRLWRVTIKNVYYQHEYTGPGNDIFLQFNVGYDFRLRKRAITLKDATGKKTKKVVAIPTGSLGDVRRSPYKADIPLHEKVSYASLESTFTQEHSYIDLYEKYLRVEVWDKESLMPNSFLGEMNMPLVSIARGGLNHVWPVNNTVKLKQRKTVVTPVGIVSFVCIFQEVLDFELRLQNWSAKIERKMLDDNKIDPDAAAADRMEDDDDEEEQVRYPYLVFRLGGLMNRVQRLKHNVLAEDINPQAAVSKIATVSYPHDAEYVLPTFRTTQTLRFRGTRTELEDQDLNIRVYTKKGTSAIANRIFRPKYVGQGSVSLEGASTGVSTTTPIAWRRKGKHTKGLERFVAAGRVTGSVSVSARQSAMWKDYAQFWRYGNKSGETPLWREFCQTGAVQPAELKVYKPFEYTYLCIRVIRCIGLLAVDEDGASDPYVSITWAGQTQSTTVRFDNCDPEFNETFYFRVRSSDPDMPTAAELEKHPFVRLSVWDYDESGSSDDLGTGKIYLHNITGAWNKDADVDDSFKPNVPTKREVMIRDRPTGPLRQRTIMTRGYTARVKLEGLPPHLESAIKIEAWFHGPGFVDETRRPQIFSSRSKAMKIKRAGDLLEPRNKERKDRGSTLLYLRKWDPSAPNVGHAHDMEDQTRKDVENFWERVSNLPDKIEERILEMNQLFPILEAVDQYGQKFLLPQYLQAIPVPAQLFAKDHGYEQSRSVCIDSQKPQTSWNIARFVQIIEWVFENDNEREFTDQLGGKDCWASPEYVFDMKKTGVTGHVLILASMFLGLKVDAWVCIGKAKIHDVEDEQYHTWVMTRESTSIESLYKFDDDDIYDKKTGAVKFWEATSKNIHVIPVLANRWEGLDEDEAFNDATGVKRKKKKKKKKKETTDTNLESKVSDIDLVIPSDSDTDDDIFEMNDTDMLAYDHGDEFEMIERGDTMFQQTEVFVKSAGMGAHGGGGLNADWAQWGRPNAKDTLKAAAQAKESERKRNNAEKEEEIRLADQAKQKAMTESHSSRIAWIEKNNSYSHMRDKCPYSELHAVFNSTQLFINMQEKCHPLDMGYDFEFGTGGGWIPLFIPAPKMDDNDEDNDKNKSKKKIDIRGEDLTRPNKGVLLPAACRLVSLGPPTSQDHVAENRTHIINGLMASITNHRHGRNLETRWEGNESLRPYLQRGIAAKMKLKNCAKVPKNGWNPRTGKWMQYFPTEEEDNSEDNIQFGNDDFFGYMSQKACSTVSVQIQEENEMEQTVVRSVKYTEGWFLNRGELSLSSVLFWNINSLIQETDYFYSFIHSLTHMLFFLLFFLSCFAFLFLLLHIEYRRTLQALHNSPPPGFAYRLIFAECCDVDPKSVSRSIMDRSFGNKVAPWDIDRVGTQFALFCHVENLPNINNVVHIALMTIYPKDRMKKKSKQANKTSGAADQTVPSIAETLNPNYENQRENESTDSSDGSQEEDADEYD